MAALCPISSRILSQSHAVCARARICLVKSLSERIRQMLSFRDDRAVEITGNFGQIGQPMPKRMSKQQLLIFTAYGRERKREREREREREGGRGGRVSLAEIIFHPREIAVYVPRAMSRLLARPMFSCSSSLVPLDVTGGSWSAYFIGVITTRIFRVATRVECIPGGMRRVMSRARSLLSQRPHVGSLGRAGDWSVEG